MSKTKISNSKISNSLIWKILAKKIWKLIYKMKNLEICLRSKGITSKNWLNSYLEYRQKIRKIMVNIIFYIFIAPIDLENMDIEELK
jgi:hypothetical protein